MNIIVVGAGPAGMMAAIRAGQLGQKVILVERNIFPGRKLLLSGKGRGNITNACNLDDFIARFSHHGGFLRDAFKKFFNQELIKFFQDRGLKLKVERQMRVFPETGRSSGILEVLKKELARNKVEIIYKTLVKDIIIRDKTAVGVQFSGGKIIPGQRVILACGGASYRFTGSTGEGIDIAKRLGHRVVELRPGLVPLETRQDYPRLCEGLTLKNIRLKFYGPGGHITSEIGELLFTRSGISGPLVLSLSGEIADWLRKAKGVYVEIDLKPALSYGQLEARLAREFQGSPKKEIKNILKTLLPQRLIKVSCGILKINPDKQASHISIEERRQIIGLLKALRLEIKRTRPLDEAMVTKGGVSLKDINPRTMESRLIKGLYFAGEMIDLDADTGGFNLQAAFSTGYLAAESAALN